MDIQLNQDEATAWANLYSAKDAHWIDGKRAFFLIFPFALFLGIIAFYLSYNSNIGNFLTQIAVLMMTIALGLGLTISTIRNLFKALYKPPENKLILQLISRRLFGVPPIPLPIPGTFQYPFVLINIKAVVSKEFNLETHFIHWFGGPALLIVFDGTGVYLQRGNQFSRTLGPGIYFLEHFETVREIVDLRIQTLYSTYDENDGYPVAIAGRTKDGIKIKFNIEISFRVIPPNLFTVVPSNREKTKAELEAEKKYFTKSPVDSGDLHAIKKAVECTSTRLRSHNYSEAKWHDRVWGSVSGELAKYITKHNLDEMLISEDEETVRAHVLGTKVDSVKGQNEVQVLKAGQLLSEKEIENIRNTIDENLRKSLGVTLLGLRVIDRKLPSEIDQKHQEMLEAKEMSRVKRIEGDTIAKQILIREKARTNTQADLITSIAEDISEVDSTDFANAVLLSLSHIFSQDLDDHMLSAFFAKDTFDTLDYLRSFLDEKKIMGEKPLNDMNESKNETPPDNTKHSNEDDIAYG